ncbi:SH3-domain-containing protein [Epithele typhae]|uniref:SH3-domain-containing protein n=1 Tax=Epithele typhae TaxID=378194 RepID=UPI002007AED8|nr:SH3-domain-containing protein [Epithele typhae]KAH9921508.1 SH3-domain-containing protein [Epithele typhae]
MTPADKDTFFALLDELSASPVPGPRPSYNCPSLPRAFLILVLPLCSFPRAGAGASVGTTATKAAAASAVAHAFSSGAVPPIPATSGWKRPDATAAAEISNSVGRVAAAQAALRASHVPSVEASSDGEPAETAKLMQGRKFGDVDMSSGKNMFASIRGSTAAKHAPPAQVAPPTAPAFQRRNDFAPPPRRVASTSSTSSASATPPPPPRRQTATPPAEESGEWVEALYDYSSADPGDLDIAEGQRILVVERTTDDWWTGELNGQRGLIPAAYVKVL